MTILAILTANGFSGGDHRRPYRRGRALRDGLPFEGAFALREQAGAHLLDHLIQRALAEMAHQFGLDASGVHRCGANAAPLVPAIELDREQDIGGLGTAISERSEERRGGKECVSPCRSRWGP